MKKILVLLTLVAILLLTACDGGTEPGKEVENTSFITEPAQTGETDESSASGTDVLAAPGTFAYEFPDAPYRKKILGLLNDQDGGNRSDSSEITAQDFGFMASVEELDLSGFDQKPSTSSARHYHFNSQGESLEDPYNKDHGIASLKGIEHFTALKELNCSSNQLTELDVSNNTALKVLNCCDNKLTELDLSKTPALETLLCHRNHIEKINVSKNIALKELGVESNRLTELDVSNNTALKVLKCYNNNLTGLNLSNNTVLENLSCTLNYIKSTDDVIGLREGAIFDFDPQWGIESNTD